MESVSDITAVLFPTVYVLFFLGTVGILAFARRRYAREVWLAGFFTTLLAVTLVGMPLLPVVDMHKFAQPSEEEETYYEIRMVDASGEELRFDDRATSPTGRGPPRNSRATRRSRRSGSTSAR
ncbi:MAG: hypothetical protein ACNA7R_08700 [Natronococcus sp.]